MAELPGRDSDQTNIVERIWLLNGAKMISFEHFATAGIQQKYAKFALRRGGNNSRVDVGVGESISDYH